MPKQRRQAIDCPRVELGGVRYVILREAVFEQLCQQAGFPASAAEAAVGAEASELELDRATLAEKLARRRQATGLSQAELARRAGIRPETLNRIERGRTTPDFATIRQLVVTMNAAERELAQRSISPSAQRESH